MYAAQCLLAMPVHLPHVLCPFVLVPSSSAVARLVTSWLAALVKRLSRGATISGACSGTYPHALRYMRCAWSTVLSDRAAAGESMCLCGVLSRHATRQL